MNHSGPQAARQEAEASKASLSALKATHGAQLGTMVQESEKLAAAAQARVKVCGVVAICLTAAACC